MQKSRQEGGQADVEAEEETKFSKMIATRLLEDPGFDVNKGVEGGDPVLCLAAERGDAAAVRRILRVPGADVNVMDKHGASALFHASHKGHVVCVELLRAAGADLSHVLRTGIYLTDLDDFQRANAVYAEFFPDEPQPARSTVQVAALPLGARVEVDCIAHS